MTTDLDRIVRRLRQLALPDPHDEREVMHADLFSAASDALVRLNTKTEALSEVVTELHSALHPAYSLSEHGREYLAKMAKALNA